MRSSAADREFSRTYRVAVADVLPFLGDDRLAGLGRHNPGWGPGRFDVELYLGASVRRYAMVVEMLRRAPRGFESGASILEVGGFMGAFPLALVRLGYRVTLSERYDYYDGAFDDLRDVLVAAGIEVLDVDFTESGGGAAAMRFDAVTNLAMLEHLAHTPRPLMENLRRVMDADSSLIVEVPNIAFWPQRLAALTGRSVLPPLRDVYDAAIPFTGHHREYTEADLRQLLLWGGFAVDEFETFNYAPQGVVPWYLRAVLEWPQRHVRSFRELLMARASLPPGVGD